MKNLITYLSKKSLSLGNGSGMTRKWFGNDSGMTRFSLASLICLCMMTIGVGNAWGATYTYDFTKGSSTSYWTSDNSSTAVGTSNISTFYYMQSGYSGHCFSAGNGSSGTHNHKFNTTNNQQCFFLGKTEEYLTLPTYSGQLITSVTVYMRSGQGSASATINIFSGSTAASDEQTASTSGATFAIKEDYQDDALILKLTNNYNTSIQTLVVNTAVDGCEWSETFSLCAGTGGNDEAWSGAIATSTMAADNTGWTFSQEKAASQCGKFGTGSYGGSAQTPTLTGLLGTLTVKFRAGAWDAASEGTTLNLATTYGTLSQSSVTLAKGKWTDYTVTITGVTTATKITFSTDGGNKRFFLDDICVSTAPSCADPTALTKGSFNSGTQKMPINWTSAAGEVDICYSSSSTPPGGTPGEGYTVIEGQTGLTSTSNTYNIDVSGLSAGNYYCWVRSVCDEDSKSSWTAITGDYFTIPGYTLTISPDPASSGTFDQTSGQTVVVGRTVSITATPAAGYTFTSWAVSGTGSTLSSTSTNPTTFTMGTANATVTGTFTAKEVTGWTWKQQSTGETEITIPDVVDLYVGQQAWFNLKSYTPADVIAGKKGYSSSYTNTYLAQDSKAETYYKTRAKAVTESTTLTLTSSSNSSVTQEITIRIKALPSVTFTDIIHGETFGAVTATVDATDKRVVYTTKKTPTHDDLDEPGSGNDCEKQHLHLAGWILKDWADLHPDATSSEISGAGSGNFYSTNADIDLVAKNGKTFYAVWSKLE